MQAAITLSYYSTLCAPAKKSFKTPEPYFTLPKHFTSRKKKNWKMLVLSSVFVASSLLLKEISNDHILHTLAKREQN